MNVYTTDSKAPWGLGCLVMALALSGCTATPVPEVEVRNAPETLTAMQRGSPCYYRGAVEHCADLSDADLDGVRDDQDQCPATPRGVAVDAVGCPMDNDQDKDGVKDDRDECPDTPTGARVNDAGCWVLENLRFQFNQHVLDPASYPELENVVEVLNNHPELRLEIQGHTDHIGSAAYNLTLSRKRAGTVRDFLVAHGIAANRLEVDGSGWSKPIADNDSEEGRAKNRRVELKPLP
ncbi:MAG: OmpA family protein [Magnetococcales bacterium]|nr:OmpA family protein [Magnetococcales bacterium]